MEALKIVLRIVLLLVSLAMCAIILMQSAKADGMGALDGSVSSMRTSQKKTKDEVLARFTKIGAVVMLVLCVASVILEKF